MSYTVKDVSEKTGLTPYTIRYYLKEGLIPSVKRGANGTRIFQDADLEYLYMIECLKICGMKISEIKQYFTWYQEGDKNIEKCLLLFRDKEKALNDKLARLRECQNAVRYKIWYYQTAKEAQTLAVHDVLDESELPPEMSAIRAGMQNVKKLLDTNS